MPLVSVNDEDRWQVWPQYMDTDFFVDNKMDIVFDLIDVNFFDTISAELTKVEKKMNDMLYYYEQVKMIHFQQF